MARREVRPVQVTVTRHVDAQEKRCGSREPGARKVTERTETWYAWLVVDGKRVRVSLGTTDEGLAWEELRRLLRQQRDRALGITSPQLEHARTPLPDHLDAWALSVASGGASADQVKLVRGRVGRLAEMAGWRRLPDLTADTCRQALARLRTEAGARDASKPHGGRSAQTRNHYLRAVRQFVFWCVETERLVRDVLSGVKSINVETDRRHDRRAPTDPEVGRLFLYLDVGIVPLSPAPDRKRMSPRQRALGYKVCMATGLRAQELRGLTRTSFDLDADPPTVRCAAAYDKRGRLAIMVLPPWLAVELRAWFGAGGGCWERFPAKYPGRLLRDDIEAAGLDYAVSGPDGSPLFWDMHALRHWFCTQAAANAPDLKTLLEMTRHSTAELALKRYAKPLADRVRAAAEAIPRPGALPARPAPPPVAPAP